MIAPPTKAAPASTSVMMIATASTVQKLGGTLQPPATCAIRLLLVRSLPARAEARPTQPLTYGTFMRG
jgi:hypothetical protein